eukprot:maker-scaffold1005_size71811-snap-gene-0.10 protein:Tk02681 transcript:maker-scaffold1005_size71811-snap-gene-0.10-mRNA-1 annotation:"isoform cra_a"
MVQSIAYLVLLVVVAVGRLGEARDDQDYVALEPISGGIPNACHGTLSFKNAQGKVDQFKGPLTLSKVPAELVQIQEVEATGTCCWEVARRRYFRGGRTFIIPGVRNFVDSPKVGSFMSINCLG